MDKITRLLPRSFKQSALGLETGFRDILVELFNQIHRALTFVGGSYEECSGMQTTLSLCWFTPGWMYFGHIGDSRIYYLPAREGGIRQLSPRRYYSAGFSGNGQINEREARAHPRRTALQKALGAGNQFARPGFSTAASTSRRAGLSALGRIGRAQELEQLAVARPSISPSCAQQEQVPVS